jgi:hypothetical protein
MSPEQVVAVLSQGQLALQQNKELVTPALLDEVEELTTILSGGGSPIAKMANLSTLDMPTIITALQALVSHERVLIGTGNGDGMQDTLLTSIEGIQASPWKITAIAAFLTIRDPRQEDVEKIMQILRSAA